MKQKKEIIKYLIKKRKINSQKVNQYINQINQIKIKNLTRTVIEERTTNFREIDVFSRLIMDRIIFIGTEINDNIANIIIAQLLFLESVEPNKEITIYINSPGGSIYPGLGIYDTMQHINPKISTICTGLAASMGAILLAGGSKNKRYALPHSRIMIHQPWGGIQGKSSDMEIKIKEMIEIKKDLYQILSNHTGKKYSEIEKDSNNDFWMKSKEAKKYGIIDNILIKNK